MPAVRWKLKNIKELLINNPKKHARQLAALEGSLSDNA